MSEALNCLRDKQRDECTGVSDTDQFISVGAANIARESILAIFSAGASQAAAGGNSAAKVANAAFYVKDAVDASQSGLELLQSESLVEALLKAGLLSIEVVGLKGSTGQVLEDGKTLCKKFDGQIRVQLKRIKSVHPSADDLAKFDKNGDGIFDAAEGGFEKVGTIHGKPIYKDPNGGLWTYTSCQKLRPDPSGGTPAIEGSDYSPTVVENRIKPRYKANEAHNSFTPAFNPQKTPEPPDAEAVYQGALRGGLGTWFGVGSGGKLYRYSYDGVSTVHFSGIIPPSDWNKKVPSCVLKDLGLR